jgi:hypothetical protein
LQKMEEFMSRKNIPKYASEGGYANNEENFN